MAIQAHHLLTAREVMDSAIEISQRCDGCRDLVSAPDVVAGQCSRPLCMPMQGVAADSGGVTYANAVAEPPTPKRRPEDAQFLDAVLSIAASARLDPTAVLQHMNDMSTELEQRRRQCANWQALSTAAMAEIDRMRGELRGMHFVAKTWREVALSKQAAAAALRADLADALHAQASFAEDPADDAQSCCGDNDTVVEMDQAQAAEATSNGRCRECGEPASAVLVLPCRHLQEVAP